jgi:glycine/sarcosine N-methyltransferase
MSSAELTDSNLPEPLIATFAALLRAARSRLSVTDDDGPPSHEARLVDEVVGSFLDGPATRVSELLQGKRVGVPAHQLEVLVSLFYSTIEDVYIGVDSHLPSRFLRVHPFLLENLAASEGPPSVALGDHREHVECHAARWARIVPHSVQALKEDLAKHRDVAPEYFHQHEQHGITLLSVDRQELEAAHEDILKEWTTDLGLWVNRCALLFEPSITPTVKELRLQLIYPGTAEFERCKRYVQRLIEHSRVVKLRGGMLIDQPLSDHDREHLLWGLETMFQPRLADYWASFVSAEARVEELGPFVEERIAELGARKPKILDAATGTGCDSIYLLERGYDVVSNEVVQKFVTFARESAESKGQRLRIRRYDWRHFEYLGAAQSFDAILAFGNSLSCLSTEVDIRAVVARFSHLLKPGGILIVDERNYRAMSARRREMMQPEFRIPPGFPYCGTSVQARPLDVPEHLGIDNDLLTLEYDRANNDEAVGTFEVFPFAEGQLESILEGTGFGQVDRYYNLREPNGHDNEAAFITYVARRRPTGRARKAQSDLVERAVVFTDVTGSSRARAELGDEAYEVEWKKHERKARQIVTTHAGKVHKTLGDGLMLSFADPLDAVKAAREITGAPGTSRLQVRAGINLGPVVEDEAGDLSGRIVNAAERICGTARPDLVVVDDRVMLAALSSGFTWHLREVADLEGVGKRVLWVWAPNPATLSVRTR